MKWLLCGRSLLLCLSVLLTAYSLAATGAAAASDAQRAFALAGRGLLTENSGHKPARLGIDAGFGAPALDSAGIQPLPGGVQGAGGPGQVSPAPPASRTALAAGEQQIMWEDFESTFPRNGWYVVGYPTWDDTSYAYFSGSWSAWCARLGQDPYSYPYYWNNMDAQMLYGPFNLSDASSAGMTFDFWSETESNHDFFWWASSADGVNRYRTATYTGLVPGELWRTGAWIDLTELCGDSSVWIAFGFESDASLVGRGTYVDNVSLTKVVASVNQPPYLSYGAVAPQTGDVSTDFTYSVRYSDADGNPPTTKNLIVDGTTYPMTYTPQNPPDTNASGICSYGPLRLGAGTHSYRFEVSDGHGGNTILPANGNYTGPTVSGTGPPPVGAPYIASLTPAHGLPAAGVVIAGSNFGAAQGTSVVTFGGTAASVNNWSASSVTCKVPAIAAGATTVTVTVGGRASNAVAFTVDVAPVTPFINLRLSGLTHGSMKLGKRVTAKGMVTPTSLAGGRVKLTVQKKRVTRWVTVKSAARTIGATGSYGWTYKPAARGAYRMRVTIAATAGHRAARTTWRSFRVR